MNCAYKYGIFGVCDILAKPISTIDAYIRSFRWAEGEEKLRKNWFVNTLLLNMIYENSGSDYANFYQEKLEFP